ncbi:MAG TPA: histidine--tRNA ligase [Candidatus Binataceae bacterium]|nr:histidine--tRNA ligase [Candidatus Binataceae bacterium]
MELKPLRGFQDWLGAEARAFTEVEEKLRALMRRYHFDEIRTPMLERSELYQRSSGETSDIVEKQMYAFTDSDEAHTSVALRPEGTPSVVRAYIDAGLDRRDPEQRFFYNGPVFRRERPQKGRYRQHIQFGVEVFGRADPACDAELLIMVDDLRRELGLTLRFEINSIGDAQCRPAYRAALIEWGRAHLAELCEDCHNRIDRNPLRLLDCKIDVKLAASAPKSIDYLCEPCRKHFATVRELLTAAGVEHRVNPQIVRGLDYYTRTTFEVISDALGAQSTVVGGGRYDGLVELMGGAPVPGIGFGLGVDRWVLMLLESNKVPSRTPDAAIIALGEKALVHAVQLARRLREAGVAVDLLSPERKLKALLTRAGKIGARFALIAGDNEIERAVVQLRDLRRGEQQEVADSAVVAQLTAQLRATPSA